MDKDLRVISTLDLNNPSKSQHLNYESVRCSTELSIKLQNGAWISICNTYSEIDIRDDVLKRLQKTGSHEETCAQRESNINGASHQELEHYAQAFHQHYIELINDGIKDLSVHIDKSKKYLNILKKKTRGFSL